MRNPISPVPALLVATLAAAACTGSVLAATHPVGAATFILKRSDVPASFNAKTDYVRPVSFADALTRYSVKAATLTKKGLVNGYESGFTRRYNGKSTAPGFYGVADNVTQFKSTSGAHWFFQHMKRAGYGTLSTAVPSIGDEVVAIHTGTEHGSRIADITFRHGDFVVSVSTSYIGKSDPLPKAVHFAKLIDHRLTAHSE